MSRFKRIRRWALRIALVLSILFIVFLGRPTYLLIHAWWHDRPVAEKLSAGTADDASRMNRTAIAETWIIPSDKEEAEKQLQEMLKRAHRDRLPVSIAGARHSMGGHTIAADGIVINML